MLSFVLLISVGCRGPDGFRRVFQKTVQACLDAGLIDGETVHVDATLIRADVSWESLVERQRVGTNRPT